MVLAPGVVSMIVTFVVVVSASEEVAPPTEGVEGMEGWAGVLEYDDNDEDVDGDTVDVLITAGVFDP